LLSTVLQQHLRTAKWNRALSDRASPLTSLCHATITPSTQGYPFYQTSLSTGIALPSYGRCRSVGEVSLDRASWFDSFLISAAETSVQTSLTDASSKAAFLISSAKMVAVTSYTSQEGLATIDFSYGWFSVSSETAVHHDTSVVTVLRRVL